MSNQDGEKRAEDTEPEQDDGPVIDVSESSWEEDTLENDIRDVVARASSQESTTGSDAASSADDPPIDEELSESLRPVPPRVPSVRPSERPGVDQASPITEFSKPRASSPLALHLRKARSMGTGIWYAGVFLWTYIIVGEYVVMADLPEFFGWSLFAGIVVGAFLHGANRLGTDVMMRVAAISVASVIGSTLFLTSVVGSSRRSEYQAISLFLLVVSLGLIFYGIRHARGGMPKPVGPPGINWPRVATWLVFAGNSALITVSFLEQL